MRRPHLSSVTGDISDLCGANVPTNLLLRSLRLHPAWANMSSSSPLPGYQRLLLFDTWVAMCFPLYRGLVRLHPYSPTCSP